MTVCAACRIQTEGLAPCAVCKAPACANCSLLALRVNEVTGEIIPESDDGKVICSRCNPPSGGSNARLRDPEPVGPGPWAWLYDAPRQRLGGGPYVVGAPFRLRA